MTPFVSIVICSRNRLPSLKKYALPSIAKLDYPCFEVVIVDDSSSDGTDEYLHHYCKHHHNIRVVKNFKAKGLCNARNVGVTNSTGDIIAFIDDDCAVFPNWLHEIVKAYTEENIAVVGGVSFKREGPEIYMDNKHVWGCNMSFRASIFNQFRFDTGLKYSHYADETDLIGRILAHGYKKAIADKALVYHYVEDAAYRKQVPLSAYLNYHYLNAKKENLLGYYKYVLTHSLRHVAIVEYGINFKGRARSSITTWSEAIWKAIYYLYVLLLEIPIAAKIKHGKEEILFSKHRTRP